MLNLKENKVPNVLKDCIDKSLNDTIYNHFESPKDFVKDITEWKNVFSDGKVNEYINKGISLYSNIDNVDKKYDKLYEDVAKKVKDKLLARGFTTRMLYSNVGFTSIKNGLLSKQRALLGKRDCYFENSKMNDSKLFHDIFINLSYDGNVSDKKIIDNSYALYALTNELSSVIPIRVFVVNHVGTNTPICYSYVLKRFGRKISPEEFLFFTSKSKRTFGFALYDILNNGYNNIAKTGNPDNTVSIANFNLDVEIDNIISIIKHKQPEKFKGVK